MTVSMSMCLQTHSYTWLKSYEIDGTIISTLSRPASVAQLDARPPGDEEVAGSTPAGSATFFSGD